MNNQLKIKDFKKIKDEIVLKDFSRVNYLVGENGCGKTSILNAISYLNETSNARVFFKKDSIVEFTLGDKNKYLIWDDNDPNKTTNNGSFSPIIYAISLNGTEKGANGISKYETRRDINIGNKNILDGLNVILTNMNQPTIQAEKIINNADAWDIDVGRRVFKENGTEIAPNFLSDGVKVFYNFCTHLDAIKNKVIKSHQDDTFFIIIEEPEINLHPKWQKQIPELINNFISEIGKPLNSRIFFFVSTHSPFVISAASNYTNQKVYLMDNSTLLNLHHESINSSDGYLGLDCAGVVAQMLGADVTDLGYPDNYCILEESSMQIILDDARNKGIIKNVSFVTAGGVDRINGFQKTLDDINKLNVLVNCNPFYKNKYYIIVDNISNLPTKTRERIEQIQCKLKDRFLELKKESLEDYYNNVDECLYNQVKLALANKPKEKGVIKGEYAKKIAVKINSAKDFSKLFGGELDFLLK